MLQTEAHLYDRKLQLQTFTVWATDCTKIVHRKKFKTNSDVVFLLASDDNDWSWRMFGDVDDIILTSEASTKMSTIQPTFDLAVLAHCNHSIVRQVYHVIALVGLAITIIIVIII
jgi:hypothetical protein